MFGAVILGYREPVIEANDQESASQGTQTQTDVSKEASDTDAFLTTLGTSTFTKVAKEETDSDQSRNGISFVPRAISRRHKGLSY